MLSALRSLHRRSYGASTMPSTMQLWRSNYPMEVAALTGGKSTVLKDFRTMCSNPDPRPMQGLLFREKKPYAACITIAWLCRRVWVLNWPTSSPNLSPAGNIWHIM